MTTYAIIETGGKQYRVSPGDVLDVERLETPPGDTINIEKVLLVNVDDQITVGRPLVEGARVVAKVEDEGKGKKIIVFKFKPKVRYRRKKGHRQLYSRIAIQEIATDGGAA
jgi:large subunit ribosomal protein L21